MGNNTKIIKLKEKKTLFFMGWLICGIGAIFYSYEFILRVEPSVISRELMRQFGIGAGALGSLIALYYYAYTPLQLIVGILTDRFGSRLILTFAVISCAIGSFIFSIANNIYVAGLGRFLIGFGSAFAFVGALKLAAEWLPKNRFALFTGSTVAFGMIGAMVGDIGLPFLINKIGWQKSLHIGTFVGFFLVPIVWFIVRDTPKNNIRDRAQKISFKKYGRDFLSIAKNREMWLAGFISCLFYLPLSLFAELWGVPFLRAVYNLDAKTAAFACSLVFMGWLFGAPLNGWLSDYSKTRKIPLVIGGFFALAIISAIIFRPFLIPLWLLYGLLFFLGFFASVKTVCFAIGRENNPKRLVATAIGFANCFTMLGGVIFQPLAGILLDLVWQGNMEMGVRIYTAYEFSRAFWMLPLLMLCGVFLTLIVKETYHNKNDLDECGL